MNKRILLIQCSLLFITCAKTACINAMEGNPIDELCILCAVSNPSNCMFGSLTSHIKKMHKIKSRPIYVCDMYTYSGPSDVIKRHFYNVHRIRLGNVYILERVRVPHLPPDPSITATQMQDYVALRAAASKN